MGVPQQPALPRPPAPPSALTCHERRTVSRRRRGRGGGCRGRARGPPPAEVPGHQLASVRRASHQQPEHEQRSPAPPPQPARGRAGRRGGMRARRRSEEKAQRRPGRWPLVRSARRCSRCRRRPLVGPPPPPRTRAPAGRQPGPLGTAGLRSSGLGCVHWFRLFKKKKKR